MSEEQKMIHVTFSIDKKLLEEFDGAKLRGAYATRSAAIAEAMRDLIVKVKRRG